MHTVASRPCTAPRRPTAPRLRRARRGRRRDRLHRAGAAAAAGAPSGRAAHRWRPRRAATAARRLPALARLWNGSDHAARSRRARRARPTWCFSRCPTRRPPSSRRRSSTQGVRVIDLSGAFRLRDAAARARWYPETHAAAGGHGYGLTELERDGRAAARGWWPTRAAIRRRRCWRWRRWRAAGLLVPGADVIIDAKSGVSGAGKTPSERTHFSEVPRQPVGLRRVRPPARRRDRAGPRARPVTFTPHLVPLDRGILATIYVRVAPGTTEEALGDIYQRAYASERLRAAGRRGAAGDQARRAHELLRHRLARRPVGPRGARVGHRQPAEGRVGPGGAEHERDARRRTRRPGCCERSAGRRSSAASCSRSRRGSQTVVAAIARDRRAGHRCVDRARRRQGNRRGAEGAPASRSGRSTACGSPTTPTLDVVVAVLAGTVNTRLVAALTAAGVAAVGLTGADAAMRPGRAGAAAPHGGRPARRSRPRRRSRATPADAAADDAARRTGSSRSSRASASARDGRLFNVNADTFAGHLAARLRAPAAGDRRHDAPACSTSAAPRSPMLEPAAIDAADRASGTATAGMIAKLRACEHALARGVGDVVIVDGRDRAALEAAALGTRRRTRRGSCRRQRSRPRRRCVRDVTARRQRARGART